MKVYEDERIRAIRTNAEVVVGGKMPSYRVENGQVNAVIADGLPTRVAAEEYAQRFRLQQSLVEKDRPREP